MVVNESEALIIGQICPVSLKTTVIMSSSVTAQSVTDNILEMFFHAYLATNIAKALKEWIFDIESN